MSDQFKTPEDLLQTGVKTGQGAVDAAQSSTDLFVAGNVIAGK